MYSRREILKLMLMSGTILSAGGFTAFPFQNKIMKRKIPSTGEELPVVGLGTWQTFDVSKESEKVPLKEVLKLMKEYGSTVIDSSPMYGRSEEVVGELTSELEIQKDFFYATKVWTSGRQEGIRQMKESMRKMRIDKIDLMQIHNLVDWQTHLKTLRQWKEDGKIRYIGITHYTQSAYPQLESILKKEKIDFVQFNYSIDSREAENTLLPLAGDKGVAVLINRPFGGGSLFSKVRNKQLPEWANEAGIKSWAQYFLKFILSNQNITCVIPGTSKPHHLTDNMQAGFGALPDKKMRERMIAYLEE